MTSAALCLWYDGAALEAARCYAALVEGARILGDRELPPGPEDEEVHVVDLDQTAIVRAWDGLAADGEQPRPIAPDPEKGA